MYNLLYGLNTSTLRYYHVYGPRQEYNEFGGVVSIFIRNMLNNERPTIFGDGTQIRSFTYVKDIVDANLLVATSNKSFGEEYNCASGISVSIQELCDSIIDKFGKTGLTVPLYDEWMIGDVLNFEIDNTKIKDLGITFRTDFFNILDEVINQMKDYIEESKNQ